MNGPVFYPFLRRIFAPCLAAVLLVVGGCESSQVPDIMQVLRKDVPERAGPPPEAPPPAPAPKPSTREKKGPSLVPFLTRPRVAGETSDPAEPAATTVVRPPLTEGVTRVALLLPLTGRAAPLGQAMLNAAQLALFSFADQDLELLPIDTGGTDVGAEAAAAAAVADGASVILGPLFASSVRAVRAQAALVNVPVLAFSSDRTVAGDGVYTLGLLPEEQIRTVVEHALSKGLTRFAVLAPDDNYGATAIATLQDTASLGGGVLVRVAMYDPAADDFTDVIRDLADYDTRRQALLDQIQLLEGKDNEISQLALKRLENLQTLGELPYDALLVAAGGKQLQNIAAHLPFFDIDPKKIRMLGTGLWDAPGIWSEPALVGGWFAAPPPKDRAAFEAQYRQVFGTTPARLSTLAYDATALAAVLAQAPEGADFSHETLTQPGGFAGRDGIFRLTEAGVAERGLAVLEVRTRGFRVVRQAPSSFITPTN